ncbi:probable PRP19 - non-snRNP spliceosome component required for DNA repair [Melanopsichium pennsylvanicum]|uniref:Pre-mRNA-processing factor 19 n=2 Tax=Melanopsichium pennsylvanicum TaxID=63383 RepID=A0AAJ5C2H3_9BASI|nr:probable PRP19-non-snRNP spliceosome component required for DNA repair [Melanopsichium pennsylvanicum 4]SNX81419.1 probable PRP19 - non-snRNP spliceosome component required for DNA repair [Melanopsichium pennsylvanicum]
MFCAISGEPPKVPVVSKKSGLVYEQRLIHKYINDNGKDPVTGDVLGLEDIIEIKSNPKTAVPRPPQHSSIPSLLTSLQNEYDAIILETFTLKKHYDNLRQELAHALYANDASARVIARLLNERDQAREALANIQGTIGAGPSTSRAAQDVEMTDSAPTEDHAAAIGNGPPADIVDIIETTAQSLSKQRKAKSKRKAPEGYATQESVGGFTEVQNLPSMHHAKPAGVSCVALSADGNVLVTGGNDKNVQVYDRKEDQVLATLKGHTKRIIHVAITGVSNAPVGVDAAGDSSLPAYIVSASEDGKVKVWQPTGATGPKSQAYALSSTVDGHNGEVTGIDIHPSGQFFGTAGRDGTLTLRSLSDGSELLRIDPELGDTYESFAFHPDGQLAATGTSTGAIRIWDVKSSSKASTLQTELPGRVTSLHFSENGYYLAAASDQGKHVEVWDLRKLSVVAKLTVEEDGKAGVASVKFDPSLQFLAVATDAVNVYANKSWHHLIKVEGAEKLTGLAWDGRNGNIVVSSLDRTVRTIGLAV